MVPFAINSTGVAVKLWKKLDALKAAETMSVLDTESFRHLTVEFWGNESPPIPS